MSELGCNSYSPGRGAGRVPARPLHFERMAAPPLVRFDYNVQLIFEEVGNG